MPSKLSLCLTGSLHSDEKRPASFRHVNGVRAWIYQCMKQSDPVFADELHGGTWPKPLSVSPLWWHEGQWELEISLLLDWLAPILLQGIEDAENSLHFGQDEFTITDVRMDMLASYEELRNDGNPTNALQIAFLTPTAHQETLTVSDADGVLRKQRKVIPLPDPALIVTSWWHKWNHLMDYLQQERIPETFRDDLSLLAISRFAGRTQSITLDGSRPFIGFVGDIVIKILTPASVPSEFHRHLRTLSRFAEYCGTGVETMRGMGQTHVSFVR